MKKNMLKKPIVWFSATVFFALMLTHFTPVTFVFQCYRAWQRGNAYENIKQGDSSQRVVQLMGHPLKKPLDNNPPTTWDSEAYADHHTDVTSRTVTTYWYSHGFASSYAIGFDARGRVVTKYRYTSP